MCSGGRNKNIRKKVKYEKIKKQKIILIVLFLIISAILLFGYSYSKYITQVNGKGVIDVAKWAFLVNGETASITNLNLAQTYRADTLVANKIAPGTKGSFDIVIDTTGSDVGIDYNVAFTNEVSKPSNLKFSYEGNTANSVKELEQFLQGTIAANAEEKIKTMTIEWEWKYETGTTEEEIINYDKKDTTDGKSLEQYQFDIIVTGSQVEPVA